MNVFRKMKLKTLLSNCDYKLAGTVIKQQYYQKNGQGHMNKLIDEFMENPGFENAVRLIDYNEMMIFYFTESRTGGLYVAKKNNTQPADGESMSDTKKFTLPGQSRSGADAEKTKSEASGKRTYARTTGKNAPKATDRSLHQADSAQSEKETDEIRAAEHSTDLPEAPAAQPTASAGGETPSAEASPPLADEGKPDRRNITGSFHVPDADSPRSYSGQDDEPAVTAAQILEQRRSAMRGGRSSGTADSGDAETALSEPDKSSLSAAGLSRSKQRNAQTESKPSLRELRSTITNLFDETEKLFAKTDKGLDKDKKKPDSGKSKKKASGTKAGGKARRASAPASKTAPAKHSSDFQPNADAHADAAAGAAEPVEYRDNHANASDGPIYANVEGNNAKDDHLSLRKRTIDGKIVHDPDFDLRTVKPELTLFPNVINTLLIDIQEMKKQIREYQMYVENAHPDSASYKELSASFEMAMSEFRLAVEFLNEFRKTGSNSK